MYTVDNFLKRNPTVSELLGINIMHYDLLFKVS